MSRPTRSDRALATLDDAERTFPASQDGAWTRALVGLLGWDRISLAMIAAAGSTEGIARIRLAAERAEHLAAMLRELEAQAAAPRLRVIDGGARRRSQGGRTSDAVGTPRR